VAGLLGANDGPMGPEPRSSNRSPTKHMRYLALLLLLVGLPIPAENVYQGKVIKIADGDTLTLLVDSPQRKIRLSNIDTPEQKQPLVDSSPYRESSGNS